MRQLFSAYPGGSAGIALLLFRCALALFIAMTATGMFALLPWLALILDLLALSLAAGFATRSIAAVAALAGIAVQLAGACPQTEFLPQILDAVALALIGPGAFSGDARLFGRSTIHLPR